MNDAAIEDTEEVEVAEVETEPTETDEVSEEVEAQEPEDSSPQKTEEGDKEEKDKIQKRFDEITKIRREEERRRIQVEQQNQELQKQLESLKPKQQPGMKLADFDYDEDRYSEYLSEQATERAKAQAQQAIQNEKLQAKQAEFAVRMSDYAAEVEDFNAVVRNPALTWMSQELVEVAQGSEEGPALLYYLAKNPDVGERLHYMSPLDRAREMGRIEATQLHKPKEPSLSKAPEPTKTLKAVEKATTLRSDMPESDKLSTEEWVRRERKRLANKG